MGIDEEKVSTYVMYRNEEGIVLYVQYDPVNSDKLEGYLISKDIEDFPNSEKEYDIKLVGKKFDSSWLTYKDSIMASNIEFIDSGIVEREYGVNYEYWRIKGHVLNGWNMYYDWGKDSGKLYYEELVGDDGDGSDKTIERSQFRDFISGNGMNEFEGTAVAVGVYSDSQNRKVFYTNAFLDKLVRMYSSDPSKIKVDWNHDNNYIGELKNFEIRENPVYRIYVRGDAGRPVPRGAGLSIDFYYRKKWNQEFQVYEAINPRVVAVSVLTDYRPGCSMCFTK